MSVVAQSGLVQIDLPSATIRWAEGGLITWGGNIFRALDPVYGSVLAISGVKESHGNSLAPLELTIAPASLAAAVALTSPAVQGSRARFWRAGYDAATGQVTGTPEERFNGVIDEAVFSLNGELALTIISGPAMMIERDIGNYMTPAFHKSIWPDETGHDQATGLPQAVAWGSERPGGSAGSGSGLNGFGGGSNADRYQVNAR